MIIDSAKYSCPAGHDVNEDSCLSLPERGIFIVADGLGGHSDGEKASLAAVDYFERSCRGGYTDEEISRLLNEANTEVTAKGDGGKTTVAAAFTENGNFIYANVGDSRVYYFRDGRIIAQTKDHSVCQASVDMGMMRFEDIRGNEDRSRLLKVLGSDEVLNIKKRYQPIGMRNGDAFLVCSDGFWEYVYETEMEADLLKSDNAETWLKHMLKRHLLRAENKGDNYTAICGIIHLDESDVVPAAVPRQTSEKKRVSLPLLIAGGAVAVAAVAFLVVYFAGKAGNGDPSDPDSSYSASSGTSRPVSSQSTESSDSSSVPEQSSSMQSTSGQSTPEQSTPEQSTPEQSTPEQSTSGQSTPEQSTSGQSTSGQSTPEQSTSGQSTPEQSTSEQSTSEQSTSGQSTPEQSTPEQSAPEQSTPEQSTSEQSTSGQSTPEQSTPEQSTPEQSAPEQSTPEQSTVAPSSNEPGATVSSASNEPTEPTEPTGTQ